MDERKQSTTTFPMTFFMTSSTDHVTAITGITPAVTLSKNGAAFAAAAGAVSEIGNGWYSLAGNATDRNTVGELIVHATGTGCDPTERRVAITPTDPFDPNLGLQALPAAAAGTSGGLLISGTNAGTLTLGAFTVTGATTHTGTTTYTGAVSMTAGLTAGITGNLTGNVTGSVGNVTGAVGSVTGAVASVTGSVGSIAAGGIASTSFATGAVSSTAFAQAAADKVWNTVARTLTAFGFTVATDATANVTAVKTVTDELSTMIQSDGGGGWQFTTSAVSLAPSATVTGMPLTIAAAVSDTTPAAAGFKTAGLPNRANYPQSPQNVLWINWTSGTLAGSTFQVATYTAGVDGTQSVTFSPALPLAPANGNTFIAMERPADILP